MPDPDTEHGLRIQLATALREAEELRDAANTWLAERDALRAKMKRLREATTRLIAVLDSPFVNVEATATTAAELTGAMSQARAALATGGDRG